MLKRTKPDKNQLDIEDALRACGFTIVDTHNVPQATGDARLAGFPDLLAIDSHALTIIGDFDRRQVIAALSIVPGIRVLDGGVIPVEVKTGKGKLRDGQRQWWQYHGLKPLVLRMREQVFELIGQAVIR